MRNNKRWIAVTALAGITAAAFITAVVVKNNLNKGPEGTLTIVQEGTDLGIKQVQVIKDKSGTVTGYTVNVESKGFGSTPMELAISFNTEKDTITGIEVVSHSETDGYGAKMTQPEFLDQFKGAKLPIYIPGVSLTSASSMEKAAAPMTAASVLKDGTYEVMAEEASNGWTSKLSMTVAGGAITEVIWDCVDADGNLKSVQAKNGEYVMTENGPNWAEQAEALAKYVIENQGLTGLTIDEAGKTDVVASVSISIGDFVAQVEECLKLASGIPAETVLKDGTYEKTAAEAHNGWTSSVKLTVSGGKITDVTWDCADADGNLKSIQSQNGEYVMTEDGATWYEQAQALAKYVIEKQGTTGLTLDESGKTDVVASVSIDIKEFVDQVEDCLRQAAGAPAIALKDGTYEIAADEAHNGWLSKLSLTVAGGKITDVVWDCEDESGNLKSIQSQNGEYVMTETGATWYEQAQALAKYVIEHQGTAGLTLDESGKTDVVASVSIDISEFVNQVEEALRQAAGVVKPEEPKKEEPEAVDGTKVDGISGATITTKAILGAINNAHDYLVNYVTE